MVQVARDVIFDENARWNWEFNLVEKFDHRILGLGSLSEVIHEFDHDCDNTEFAKNYIFEILKKFNMLSWKLVDCPVVENANADVGDLPKFTKPSLCRSLIGSLLVSKESLRGFSDSDYVKDFIDCKSTSGYVFFLGNSAFSWNSRKQDVVAQSTAKAEYIATATATN
ncbi:uncharacterized protein LOC110426001 [Herrania umbratica]|uniref:Uncharacterized protein LOC110426001 n=1 Tax=Herrania umbratica TaxID=108875 RepID=A0A6J1BBA8_9ROSI|nr:uncharacterized protein LOC110426001 [Herrania umbratica]